MHFSLLGVFSEANSLDDFSAKAHPSIRTVATRPIHEISEKVPGANPTAATRTLSKNTDWC
jgi:hypothetical protein